MKVPLEPISCIGLVLSCLVFVDGRGGSGGGGGGGGGGRGGGGYGGGGSRGAFGRSSGRGLSRTRVGGAAVILGSGAAGYAAYRAHQNAKRDRERGDKDNPDFDSFEQYIADIDGKYDYKLQESTSYYASEGIGMSAWGLVFLILAVIALGTVGWYCCNVFLPVWQDNRQMRRRSMLGNRLKDEMPLQETPSTATPSP